MAVRGWAGVFAMPGMFGFEAALATAFAEDRPVYLEDGP